MTKMREIKVQTISAACCLISFMFNTSSSRSHF